MSVPAYQLRPNKAVDRLAFVDVIRRLERLEGLDEYSYYSLGGPFLDDFRMLYDVNPSLAMISIDSSKEVIKRQKFHLPSGRLQLRRDEFGSFITQYEAKDRKSIFWLDYTGLEYSNFEDFMALLPKVAANSVVKITLRANWTDYKDEAGVQSFKDQFAALMPEGGADPPTNKEDFAALIQAMVRIAGQKALPAVTPLMYQPLCSFYYADGAQMLTVTGVVCLRSEKKKVRSAFKSWSFASLNWAAPQRIDMPVLTTKERLHLQHKLPCSKRSGQILRRTLGYLIDETKAKSEAKLRQYARFHRYAPYYIRSSIP